MFTAGDGLPRRGPTVADMRAIEAEWPVISAQLAALDAEIATLRSTDELSVRRARRSARRALTAPLRRVSDPGSVEPVRFGGDAA